MNEEVWRKITSPDENRYIGAIFGAVWKGAAAIRAQPHKNFGLKRKDRRPIESDQLVFSRIFNYVAQVVSIAPPEVFLQDQQPGDILLANCIDKQELVPSVVVRQNLLQGRPEKEVAYVCARWLTFMRPEHYLKLALPSNTELKVALLAAIWIIKRDFPIPNDISAAVQQYAAEMVKWLSTQPAVLEQLGMVVNRFLANAPEVNLAKWGHAVDATARRVGFIVCGDLDVAANLARNEPTVVGGPTQNDKVRDLVLFSVSEDYFAVRKALQLTIG
jgi:hypothetical protein